MKPAPMKIAYGPIASRRLGQSLGVNLVGDGAKACSFDCVYCDLGPTEVRLNRLKKDIAFPTPEDVRREVETELRAMRDRSAPLDWICISGNGEPTLHPEFDEASAAVLAARDAIWPEIKVTILTNGANADSRSVRAALNKLDARMMKLDAGNERVFKSVNEPIARTTLAKAIANARLLKDVVLQSLFVKGAFDNSQAPDIEDWIEAVAMVNPRAVHILGMSRAPARAGLERLTEDELYTIASKLERRTQIKALVFL